MTSIENMKLSEIIQYENNLRNNEAAVDKVAVKLGLEIVPVIKADDLTEQKAKAFRIMDNKSSEFATWNYEALLQELEELRLDEYNLDLTGFNLSEFEQLEDKYNTKEIQEDEDFNIEEQLENIEEPKSKKGDLWLLGNNRLLCGDSTLKENVEKLMSGHKAKLVFTDPPYNVNYEGVTSDKLTIANDNMSQNEFYEFLSKVFNNYYENMEEGTPIYVYHADSEGENFRRTFRESGLKLAQCIIWVKNAFVIGRQDYQWKHEPILYGWKEGKAHYFVDDRTQDTVWEIQKPTRNAEHPTMKPLVLCARAIKNSSKPNDLVIDLFGGSGSTLMAATELNRICYTMELDEKYADVIVLRYINQYGANDVYLLRDGEKIPYSEVQ